MASNSFLDENKKRIEGIAKANNVDMSVAKDMFISNITRGTNYKGGGVADMGELNKAWQASIRPTGNTGNTGQPQFDSVSQILEAQRIAEQKAIQDRINSTVGSIESYRPQVQQSYEDSARQAYINQMRGQGSLKDVLSAQGYSGGMSETAGLGLNAEYNQALNESQKTKQQAESEIDRMIADARMTGNTDLANAMAQYYQNYIGELQNQQQQSNYMSELQAQQEQATYDNAYKLFAQGVRTPGVLKALGIEDYAVAPTGSGTNKWKTTGTVNNGTVNKNPTGIDWSDSDINKLSAANQRNAAMLITQYKSKQISEADFIKRMKALGVNADYTY